MSANVIYQRGASYAAASATTDGNDLWLSQDDLHASSGWELKPQGLCLGDRCVPLPPGRSAEFVSSDNRINLTAFARYLGQPIVHDDAHNVWVFGEAAAERRNALQSLQAPDFTLPDLDGNHFSLKQFRGHKVLLMSWASW
jgi:hypothetical protein